MSRQPLHVGCTVEDCDRKHHARGYCRTCYGRLIERKPKRVVIHLEDVELLAASGEGWTTTAARLGVKPLSIRRHLERAGRRDLIQRLQGVAA